MKNEQSSEFQDIIYATPACWKQGQAEKYVWELMPDWAMQQYLESLSPDAQEEASKTGRPNQQFRAAMWWFRQFSLKEAKRLGFTVLDKWPTLKDFVAVIEMWDGDDFIEKARKYMLDLPYRPAIDSHEVLTWRRDGDAVIYLAGMERHPRAENQYYVGVVWAPQQLVNAWQPGYEDNHPFVLL